MNDRIRIHCWLIRFLGLIVPQRLRADWRQEWEAELRYRETMLAEWDKLSWQNKLDLWRRSIGALWDALWLQPQRWEDEMMQDIRFGARMLLKHKGFTFVAVLTLALGIGANTAIFSLFNGLVLKPLPYQEPERLVNVRVSPQPGLHYQTGATANFSTAGSGQFHDWQARSRSFESLTAYRTNSTILSDGEQSRYVVTMRVAEDFFATYGMNAQVGRTFTKQDYGAASASAIMLDYHLWQTQYGADPQVIGRTIKLDGAAYTVIGVMPPAFWPVAFVVPHVWVPYSFNAEEQTNRQAGRWNVMARLRPGVSVTQAQDEMDALAAQLNAEYPEAYKNSGIVLIPLSAEFTANLGEAGRILELLLAAVALVLLIACVNVANLLLVRASEREREFAVRAALGASSGRLARQLLTESLILAMLGGGLGVLLGLGGMRFLAAQLAAVTYIPRLNELRFDGWALAFTAGVTLATSLLFGLVPALRVARPHLQPMLNESGRGNAASRQRRRIGNVLVAGEIALAMLLLLGAGLIVQSFLRLQRVDPGFAPGRLLTMTANVPDYKYGRFGSASRPDSPEWNSRIKLFRQIEERLNALPGVEAAAVAERLPVANAPVPTAFHIAERATESNEALTDDPAGCRELRSKTGQPCHGTVSGNRVSNGYFHALGMRLLQGRWFDARDQAGTPLVAVISETTARRYWPHENPVGQHLTLNYAGWFPQFEIIGVVSDIRTDELNKPFYPELYQTSAQFPSDDGQLLIRTKTASENLASSVRAELARLDQDLPLRNVISMESMIAGSLWRARLAAWLLGGFAALAVALAAAGLYSVMSYTVSQRTNEIGIRMALGATAADVLQMVLREGSCVVLVGLAAGIIAALTLSRVLANFVFGVATTDPLTYFAVALLLAFVALLACWIPARRATKVDPMIALRHD